MSIAAICPNCDAKFNLADELEGKTVKCKRCQTSFIVPSADAIAPKPPRASAREKDEDDDDDRDRSEPPRRKSRRRDDDDDEDDRDDDDEDDRRRSRRRSGSRQKRAPRRKQGSSMMAIVLILVGVGALLLVCCGVGGVVAVVKLRDPVGAAGANTRVVLGPDGTFRHENRLSHFDRMKDGKRFRTYTMKMEAGKTYQFDMVSNDLDSFLFILDDTGAVAAWDDDGGGFPNARIVFRPQRTGEFTIETTSFMDRETGTFFLNVRRF
jgi:predicted Zn finger-like uncharacterized protein